MKRVFAVIVKKDRRWVPIAIYDTKIIAQALADAYANSDVVEVEYYPGTFSGQGI